MPGTDNSRMLVEARAQAVFPPLPDCVAPQEVDRKVGEDCEKSADGEAPEHEGQPDLIDALREPLDGDVFRRRDAGPAQQPVAEQVGADEDGWNREGVRHPDQHQADRDIRTPENRARNNADHLQGQWHQRPEDPQCNTSRNRATIQVPEIGRVEVFTKELQEPVITDCIGTRAVAFDELFWHYGSVVIEVRVRLSHQPVPRKG